MVFGGIGITREQPLFGTRYLAKIKKQSNIFSFCPPFALIKPIHSKTSAEMRHF